MRVLVENDLIIVGKIRKCFGVNGEVSVESLSHSLSRFRKLKKVYLGFNQDKLFPTEVISCRINLQKVILKFSSFNNISEIQDFIGSYVFIDSADSIRPPEGKFFQHELLGLDIVDKNAVNYGVLKEILSLPAYDIYIIKYHNKDVLIPAIPEFIISVDLKNRKIVINVVDGLFDV
jgi:16S rRNA processing protein RimM